MECLGTQICHHLLAVSNSGFVTGECTALAETLAPIETLPRTAIFLIQI